ncbi:MAG: 2-oxoacid:acceptor oxidoreductase family protein [Planctomycetaceae bacterium]
MRDPEQLRTLMHESLQGFAVELGIPMAASLLEDDVIQLCGSKSERVLNRAASRHGSQEGYIVLGGQKVADALVAMNPAALVTNLKDLRTGGLLIVNEDSFEDKDLKLARLRTNPLDGPAMENYRLVRIGMTKLTREAVAQLGLGPKDAERCKNFFALGLVYWLYGRDLDATLRFIRGKFAQGAPVVAKANEAALRAGWSYGETIEAFGNSYQVEAADLPPGHYRNIMGNQAMALGLVAAAHRSNKEVFYASYPITPASVILHCQWLRTVADPGRESAGTIRNHASGTGS